MSVPPVKREYVACRTIGHSWDDLPPVSGEPVIRLRCVRCTMQRLDTVSITTGHVVRRRYIPPVDYYLSGIVSSEGGAPRKDEWRREFLIVSGMVSKKGKMR